MQRGGEVASRELHVAELVIGHGEIALPFGIVGIGLGQAVGNGEFLGIGLERGGEVALRELHVGDLFIARSEVALPAGITGIGLGQSLADKQGCRDRIGARRRGCLA